MSYFDYICNMKVIEKSFTLIDRILSNVINGINTDINLYRYNMLCYYIKRYIQYNLMIGNKDIPDYISFNNLTYLNDLYVSIYKEAIYLNQLLRYNERWTAEENANSYFNNEVKIYKKYK